MKTPSSPIIFKMTVTSHMVTSFARLTGDWNSLHTNEEIARKSRFRQPIVHGMLPFSFVSLLQFGFSSSTICFQGFKTRFHKAVLVGDEIRLELSWQANETEVLAFEGRWYKQANEELLITTSGRFCLIDVTPVSPAEESQQVSFINETIGENSYSVDELEGKSEVLPFKITEELQKNYVESIFQPGGVTCPTHLHLCPNLFTTLLLSTMVGMRLPGRYAVFMGFRMDFPSYIERGQQYRLYGTVTRTSVSNEEMVAAMTVQHECGKVAEGKVRVMLHPPPKVMVSCEDIRVNHLGFGLADKVVLITGASRGIGETTAKLFGALGSTVIVNYYRGKEDAERIVREIEVAEGKATTLRCDISQETEVKHGIEAVLTRFGRIDVLVNNAVGEFTSKNVLDLGWEDYLQEMEISVKGLHACCQAVIPQMKELGCGKIINMSTVALDNPVVGQSRYITAKSAVVGYTKSLAKELAPYNIQVNLVVPNMTDTDLVSGIPSAFKEKMSASNPYKRHVLPIEVAQSIAFLASNWSNAMTGQKLVLNLGEVPFA